MHYTLLVILNRPPTDLRSHMNTVLAPFRFESEQQVRPRWDWFAIGDGPFSDGPTAGLFSDLDEDEKTCVCRIGHLPTDYSAAALLTPDGAWHDIEDFGWRLLDGESEKNGGLTRRGRGSSRKQSPVILRRSDWKCIAMGKSL